VPGPIHPLPKTTRDGSVPDRTMGGAHGVPRRSHAEGTENVENVENGAAHRLSSFLRAPQRPPREAFCSRRDARPSIHSIHRVSASTGSSRPRGCPGHSSPPLRENQAGGAESPLPRTRWALPLSRAVRWRGRGGEPPRSRRCKPLQWKRSAPGGILSRGRSSSTQTRKQFPAGVYPAGTTALTCVAKVEQAAPLQALTR
jgi:hypothetical protein